MISPDPTCQPTASRAPKANPCRAFTLICGIAACSCAQPLHSNAGMLLELGPHVEYVYVTAEYSNAVLLAVLPYISEVAQKLDLPLPRPITARDVVTCAVLPNRRVEAAISIKGNWNFGFSRGYIETIQGPHYFFGIEDSSQIPDFFGELKMAKPEAIQLARDTLTKLGIPLDSVFAEQEARVTGPITNGTNTVPHYRIEWLDPRCVGQAPGSVQIDIDAQAKRVERITLRAKCLERPPPRVAVTPPRDPRYPIWPQVNPEYALRLLPIALNAVGDFAKTLGLGIPQPLTTNHVRRLSVSDNGGWPHSELELTNGWRFIYRNSMVNGFYTPDNLFNSDNRPILVKDFLGEWRVREPQARDLVRRALAKLNYPANLVHFEVEPQVSKPAVQGIPRFLFSWNYARNDELQSLISAEVDADRGELKSLYYDDKAYWNHPPPIDVPISLPPPSSNQPSTTTAPHQPQSRHPIRPPSAFNAPTPKSTPDSQ